jgi:hypothetical protein
MKGNILYDNNYYVNTRTIRDTGLSARFQAAAMKILLE